MTRKQFYLVVHGRQPGIDPKWFGEEGAAEQVEGLDKAIFKGSRPVNKRQSGSESLAPKRFRDFLPIC